MKWNKYVLKTTTEAMDLVSVMLMEQGITGIEIKDNVPLDEEDKKRMFIDLLPELPPDEGVAYITFYTDDNEDEAQLLDNVRNELEELRDFVNVGDGSIEKSETEDEDWINNWKAFFKAFSVDDIVIKPSWEEKKPEYEGKLVIEIDPGIAFGTGMHETTQLCIRQLKKYITSDTKVFDIGCGSGILSIIALKLGAHSAVGIDIDENATIATRENLMMNNLSEDVMKVYTGNILEDQSVGGQIEEGSYDVVVANILADVLVPLTPAVPYYLKKGGYYITSGIIDMKEEEVKAAIEANGNFEIVEITRQKDWSSITARRI